MENEETLRAKADALLKASAEYWDAYHKAGLRGAVVWIEATDGQLVVLTRGEYKVTIMQNIEPLQKEPYSFVKLNNERGLSPTIEPIKLTEAEKEFAIISDWMNKMYLYQNPKENKL